MVFTWNDEPSKDLSYSSLEIDETNRQHASSTIPRSERFKQIPANGNLASVIPDASDPETRKTMDKRYQIDTATRTVFTDHFYDRGSPIHDFVSSPVHKMHAPQAPGHVTMDTVDPTDTRIRKVKYPYTRPLGPGSYSADPLGERATGTLTMSLGETHHSVSLARDPTRESASFRSPERHHTVHDIAEAQARPPVVSRSTEPDYDIWTRKGFGGSRADRNIEADRWGKNVREMKPSSKHRPQAEYDVHVTKDGRPASTQSYTAEPTSPSYKMAFCSGKPRLIALPDGKRADSRFSVAPAYTYEELSTTDTSIGPGSYNPEIPRLTSANASYVHAEPYYSNASGTPTSYLGLSMSHPASPAAVRATRSVPSSPLEGLSRGHSPERHGLSRQGASPLHAAAVALALPKGHVSHNFHAPLSAPCSPMSSPSARAAGEMAAVRAYTASMSLAATAMASHMTLSAPGSPAASPGPHRMHPSEAAAYTLLQAMHADAAQGGRMHHHSGARGALTPTPHGHHGGAYGFSASAPATPSGSRAAAGAVYGCTVMVSMAKERQTQFGKLMFTTRATPHKALIRSRLAVVQDMRRERACRAAQASER